MNTEKFTCPADYRKFTENNHDSSNIPMPPDSYPTVLVWMVDDRYGFMLYKYVYPQDFH